MQYINTSRINTLFLQETVLDMSTRIIVDEEEPLNDNADLGFSSRDVQVRNDKWVTDEFEISGFLGRGKFGEVKRCSEISTGREFAAKFISAPRPQDKKDVEHEINIMKQLRHKRLIQLYDAFECKTEMCLILEIIYGGELFDRVISEDFLLTEKACLCFIRQICEGIEYMHSANIIHLDMKPENILCLSQSGNRVKIIDFGLAREWNPKKDLRVLFGTPEFMAPEVVQYEPITFATDMWSVGVICYVLLSGLSPFMGDTDADTLQNVIEGDYDFDYPEFEDISDEAKDLVAKLLVKDKKTRLTARDCLEHPWLQRKLEPQSPSLDLSKKRLKTFVYRRKWQKIVNAIIALKRMGVQLMALKKSSLDMLEPGASVIHPEILASHQQALALSTSSTSASPAEASGSKKPPPTTDSKPSGSLGGGSGSGFFTFGRKKSSKTASGEKKGSSASMSSTSSQNELPPSGVPQGQGKKKELECKPKTKNKTKESSGGGGFFGKLKKQKDINKDKDKDKNQEDTPVKQNQQLKDTKQNEHNELKATASSPPLASAKPIPPAKPVVPAKPSPPEKPVAAPPKPRKGLVRDSSLRRSTKLSKQGAKGEQYISLEKAAAKKVHNSPRDTGIHNDVSLGNDIAASTPNLAMDVNGLGAADTQKTGKSVAKPSGYGTFSRVRDRIKFLEQKETPSTETLRKKKGQVQSDHGRAS